MLQVGDQVRVEDVWRAIHLDSSGASVKTADRGSYPVGYYRRPITETHIHGSGTYAVDIATTEETITEVREAWLKDHMEMKRKLDARDTEAGRYENLWTEQCDHVRELKRHLDDMTKSWFDQRAELADARNKITDLQKTEKAAQSCNLSFSQKIDTLNTILSETRSVNHDLKKSLDLVMSIMVSAEARIADKNATIRRLKEKMESVEPYLNTQTACTSRIAELEQRISALQKDLEKPRRDLMSETDFGLRSRVKLMDERDEAIAEVKRLRVNSRKEQLEYEKRCDLFHQIEKAFYDGSDTEAFVAALRKKISLT